MVMPEMIHCLASESTLKDLTYHTCARESAAAIGTKAAP